MAGLKPGPDTPAGTPRPSSRSARMVAWPVISGAVCLDVGGRQRVGHQPGLMTSAPRITSWHQQSANASSFTTGAYPPGLSHDANETMSKQTLNVRWGILATGGIAKTFAKDLTVDPKTRNVNAITHTVVAAASSSSKERAADFLKQVDAPSSAKAYGSYDEFVKDPDIDIVYVATPHSHHYQNAMLCLEAGKNVLCEKAFTVNAEQAKILVKKAREKVNLSTSSHAHGLT